MNDNLEKVIDESKLIKPEHKSTVKKIFSQDPPDLNTWFFTDKIESYFRQGDVISSCNFLSFVLDEHQEEEIDVLKKMPAIILTSTCDMQEDQSRGEHCLIAPLMSFETYKQYKPTDYSAEKWNDYLIKIKASKINELLYVPRFDSLDESVVYLDKVCSVSPDVLRKRMSDSKSVRIASLSQYGWYFFMAKLSHYFIRFEGDDCARFAMAI